MVSRRRFLAASASAAALPLAGVARARTSAGHPGVPSVTREVTALTYNLGLGTNLFDALGATSVDARAVHDRFTDVTDSGVPERMAAIARLIDESGAALVGLQEVALLRRGPRGEGPATEVVADFLAELRAALSARDAGYRVAVAGRNADEQFPADPPDGEPFAVRLTDRDVVLVREDVAVRETEAVTYGVNLTTVVEGQRVSAERGYALAECAVDGVPVTVAATHLEAGSRTVRRAQAAQLVGALRGRRGALVVAADVNSTPDDPSWSAYGRLAAAFRPVAAAGESGDGPPPTCCQRAQLGNDRPSLSVRLDDVFVAGPVGVRGAWRVGESPGSRVTVDGERLWPSDHAGVAARLAVSPSPSNPAALVRAALGKN